MAYIRWLYKSWNIFWTFIGVLVLSVAILAGSVFGVMQLQPVKNFVAEQLENQFSEQYQGVISVGQLEGLLPLNMQLQDVKVYPDKQTYIPAFQAKSIEANFDVWSILQNRLMVHALRVDQPQLVFDADSSFSLEQAFVRQEQQVIDANSEQVNSSGNTRLDLQLIIPSVTINGGRVLIRNSMLSKNSNLQSDSVQFQNLNMQMFFEFTNTQRFLDIDNIQFDVPELGIAGLKAYGQIYNDDQFFEVNALTVSHQNSSLRFNGEVNELNVLNGNIRQQLEEAEFSYLVDNISLTPQLLTKIIRQDSQYFSSALQGTIEGNGTMNVIRLTNSEFIVGDSFIRLDGEISNYQTPEELSFVLNAPQISLARGELQNIQSQFSDSLIQVISETGFEGQFSGGMNRMDVILSANHFQRGEVTVDGEVDWSGPLSTDIDFTTNALDIGDLVDPRISNSDLTLTGQFRTNSFDFRNSRGGLSIQSEDGSFDNRNFNQLSILANWNDGLIEPDVRISFNDSQISTNGSVNLRNQIPAFSLSGSATNLDIKELSRRTFLEPVMADLEFDVNVEGRKLQDIYGQVSLDILEARFEDDTLGRHQLYVDFNAPDSPQREIRLTSTAFDANIQGNFSPGTILEFGTLWSDYFVQRYYDEIALDTNISVQPDTLLSGPNQDVTLAVNFKNLALLNTYIPSFPILVSTGRFNSTVNVNNSRLLFNASFTDSKTSINGFEADSVNFQATGGFRRGEKLKDFSSFQMQFNAAYMDYDVFETRKVQFGANLNRDLFSVNISAEELADEAVFNTTFEGSLKEDELTIAVNNFELRSDAYHWQKTGNPMIRYFDRERLALNNFTFESDSQFVQVDGTFSSLPEDSVNYKIEALDLGKISQILDIRLNFAGKINGDFTTTTLTTIPTIQGNIDIEQLYLNNNLYGDLAIRSRYNPDLRRFDTRVISSTDSAKYPQYFENSGRRGQFFQIDGYVLAPQDGQFPQADTLYSFESEFENIDLWVLPLIGPKVFAEGAGLAHANGRIWGNLETFDYEVDITVGAEDAAFIRPQFLETDYYAQGEITWNRQRGFTFHDIYLIDPSGGSAILSGFYDVNDFAPTDTMNIDLDMDEFQFLNSSFDPTVAFFGDAYGSGVITISGTNLDPVISTQDPILITDFSEVSIPLLEETEFNEDNRFIRFVNSFDDQGVLNSTGRFSPNGGNGLPGATPESAEELTFAERFTLDLQFVAENPMNVRLIFDPVTGDIITAQGTGRLRILLEDEEVSMFGRFDISGGRYQFVSGDIFTRRFEIEPGGTIVWEGDPANARLDVNAIYSARPDINTLSGTGTRDPENAQRVPVELVLNIGGTITSIENNFFFRLPDTFEAQQNSTLSTQLASINRDENLKLLQATNFMLMGDFIPVSSSGEAQANLLGENISGSAAVLNPLLSSQVINPLLSNQVNSLLNSDLSSLDVDFNLNTYNQVDLGVALRLYNDKLILRREGQITGRQSNIGDLGATYRINQTFAVTAFHRQDLTFGTLSSTEQSQQSQEINGVGLEAKVSFNTWDEFFKRLFSPFRKLFGVKEEQQNQEEITENRQDQNPA